MGSRLMERIAKLFIATLAAQLVMILLFSLFVNYIDGFGFRLFF